MKNEQNAIAIEHLSVQFGDFRAVDDVSFTVRRGEIFGFLGANGAGKTTTIRVMCGLLVPSGGTVRIAGLTFGRAGGRAIKEKVGYMSQKFTLYDDLTVAENMAFKAALRGIPEDAAAARQRELFDFIGFAYPGTTLVRDLPSGIKQQLSLAATLLHEPEIIFLDEPTAGVSPAVRLRFWELIRQLAGRGRTVIVTTHYMDEAEQCDRIALMRAGKLIALDSPAGLKSRAYPEPLVEVAAPGEPHAAIAAFLERSVGVRRAWPYGLRYHAAMQDAPACAAFLKQLPSGYAGRGIAPSLEDVFVKLVEGVER
jgi:ABC-2 type transport system ATP-binding protein